MDAVSADEKIAYFKSLIALANVDGEISDPELEIIRQAAQLYDCTLRKSYLKSYDIEKLADQILNKSLRSMLLNDFKRLLELKETPGPEELSVVKYYADRFKLAPPMLPEVNWRRVALIGDVAVVSQKVTTQSARRGKQVYGAVAPSFQWLAVFAGAGVFFTLTLSILVAVDIAGLDFLKPTTRLDEIGLDPVILGIVAGCFFTSGLLVALLSPGRTIKEPAVGALIPILLLTTTAGHALYQQYEALKAQKGSLAALPWLETLGPLLAAAVGAYILALIGAWIGEAVSGSKQA